MAKHVAIVLAAGSGSRMKSDLPKQFMPVNGKPLIYYSLKAFEDSFVDEIVLVTSAGWEDYCRKEILEKYNITKVSTIITGGNERYDSVYNGLVAIREADYAYIHDGARPMLTQDILLRAKECVEKNKACIAGMPSKDTIKIADKNAVVVDTPDRSTMWIIQTPQVFDYDLIKRAYEKMYEQGLQNKISVTDDAQLVEYTMNHRVCLFEGSYRNIKVTTPEDIAVIEAFLKI